MKKLSLFTALVAILSFSSCEKDTNDVQEETTAELIIGNWDGETVVFGPELTEETIQMYLSIFQSMSPDEFLLEFEIPMPTTDEEWLQFIQEFAVETDDISDETLVFTETTMTLSDEDGVFATLNYNFTSSDHFTVEDPEGEFLFTYFDILTCTETDLVLTSSAYDPEEDISMIVTVTFSR